MKDFDIDKVVISILFFVIIAMGIYTYNITNHTEEVISEIEKYEEKGKYTAIYQDKEISMLRKMNQELYDSLQSQKEEIKFLTRFNYNKKFTTDTIFIYKDKEEPIKVDSVPQVYTYTNTPNDTMKYELKIGSYVEPNWYHLDFEVSDQFTIVNKKVGENMSETNIESLNGATITDVTVFNQKQKKSIWDRIAIGPSITAGYDITHNRMGINVGISVTYDLFEK